MDSLDRLCVCLWIGYEYGYSYGPMAIPRCLYQYEYIVSQDKSVAKVCT